MKKILLVSAMAIFGLVNTSIGQKQIGGDKNFEVNMAPFGNTPISINGIKFRYFTEEDFAYRVEFNMGGKNVQTITEQSTDEHDALAMTESSFKFSIRPGVEKHLKGTNNLSPYFGAFLDFTSENAKVKDERWGTYDTAVTPDYSSKTTVDGSTSIGLSAVAGADYYVVDNLYLGLELSFGWMRTKMKDTTYDYERIDLYEGDANATKPDPSENGKMSTWGPGVNALIRVGYLIN